MCVLAEATPILNICYRIVIDPSGAVAVQLEVCVLALSHSNPVRLFWSCHKSSRSRGSVVVSKLTCQPGGCVF